MNQALLNGEVEGLAIKMTPYQFEAEVLLDLLISFRQQIK